MAKREWMVGQLDRGMGRSSFAVCELSGVQVEATLENVTLQAAAPEMAEMLLDLYHGRKTNGDIDALLKKAGVLE